MAPAEGTPYNYAFMGYAALFMATTGAGLVWFLRRQSARA